VERINLSDYSWIHFEARGVVKQMLQYIQEQKSKLNVKVSVEIEKNDQGFENLLDLADLVFLSKDFATHEGGAKSADEAIEIFKDRLRKGNSYSKIQPDICIPLLASSHNLKNWSSF
jgi:hypothetical protein